MTTFAAELDFAHHLADLAADIGMRSFRNADTAVRFKGDGTPVTQADTEIEDALRKELAAAYPEDAILGEEQGSTGDASRRWLLDPIDGTKNFSWGIRNWATLIALEADGEVVVGIASAPAIGERFAAVKGGGARRNDEPIHVSDTRDLAEARLGFTSAAEFEHQGFGPRFRRALGTVAHDRGIGDFYGHMLVAAGSLDVMVEPRLNPWDLGPLIVIVEEAGGRLTDLAGARDIYSGSVLTTNGHLHEAALSLFSGP